MVDLAGERRVRTRLIFSGDEAGVAEIRTSSDCREYFLAANAEIELSFLRSY